MADVQERTEGNATSGFLPRRGSSITSTATAEHEYEYEEGGDLPILTFSVVGWTCKAHCDRIACPCASESGFRCTLLKCPDHRNYLTPIALRVYSTNTPWANRPDM